MASSKLCAYCKCSIGAEQRWVREKIYEPGSRNRQPRYRYYHANGFAEEVESCWEKHQLRDLFARTATG